MSIIEIVRRLYVESMKANGLLNDCDVRPMVSVVVLNHNGKEQIRKCFKSVLNMDYSNYEVIFVDNGSKDGSLELAKELAENASPICSFIEIKKNIGYSRGKNIGVSASKGKYVWLLDNDIEPEADCLQKLVDFMNEHPKIASCGPTLLDYENSKKVIGGGYIMTYLRQPRVCKNVLDKVDGFRYVSYMTGGVIFVSKKIWEKLGGFEDSGMFFLDDNDFGARCWISGWKVALVYNCFARHFHLSRRWYNYWRWRFRQFAPGTIRGMIRNYSIKSLFISLPSFLVYILLKAFKNALCRFDPRILLDLVVSLLRIGKELPESLRQRRKIQRLRVVPDDPFMKL